MIILDEFFDEEQTFINNISSICLKLSTSLEETERRAAAQEQCVTVSCDASVLGYPLFFLFRPAFKFHVLIISNRTSPRGHSKRALEAAKLKQHEEQSKRRGSASLGATDEDAGDLEMAVLDTALNYARVGEAGRW